MAMIVALFSNVVPMSIEMLDDKSAILRDAETYLPILNKEIGALMRSYRELSFTKRGMGAFSTSEQNATLRRMRVKHQEVAPTVSWLLGRISEFYSKYWFKGDTNSSMLTILEMHDDLMKYVKGI